MILVSGDWDRERWWSIRVKGGRNTYIFSLGVALQVGLDGLVLLVELGQVWNEVFDDVGVG